MIKSSSDLENEHDEESRRISSASSPASTRPSNETTLGNSMMFQAHSRYNFSEASGEHAVMSRSRAALVSTESRSARGDGNQSKRRRLIDESFSNNNVENVIDVRTSSSNSNTSISAPYNIEDLLSGPNLRNQRTNLSASDRDQLILRFLQQVEGGSTSISSSLSQSALNHPSNAPDSTFAISDFLAMYRQPRRPRVLGLQNSSPRIVDQVPLLNHFQPANNLATLLVSQLQQQRPNALLEQQRTIFNILNHAQVSSSSTPIIMDSLQPLHEQYRRLLFPATSSDDRNVAMPLGLSSDSLPSQRALSFIPRLNEPISTTILQLLQSPTTSNQAIPRVLQLDSLAPGGLDQGLRNHTGFNSPVDSYISLLNRPSIAESLVPNSLSDQVNRPTRNVTNVVDQLRSSLNMDLYSDIVGTSQQGGNPQRVSSQASIRATEVPSNAEGELCLPRTIARPEDTLKLSENQCLLRQQIEAFQAAESDVSTHTRGRNKPITLKQVGIRCIHCAHLAISLRHKGSTYFPASVHGLYQAAQNMSTTHIQSGLCSEMPESLKCKFAHLSSMKVASSGAGRPYWASAAKDLGLIDTDQGIFFIRDLPPHVNLIDRGGSG